MKNKELFDHSVSVLVRAYFEGTLASGTCNACAVGNLIVSGLGLTYRKDTSLRALREDDSFYAMRRESYTPSNNYALSNGAASLKWHSCLTRLRSDRANLWPENIDGDMLDASKEIDSTGYSLEEIIDIEGAFESGCIIHYANYCRINKQDVLEDQFRGLMGVMDTLFKIHEVTNTCLQTETRKMFVHPDLQPV